ncbi:hypothetical protein ACWIEX_11190 [Bosea sp. NPDC055353]
MATDQDQTEEARLFPLEQCVAVAAELNAWTSVQAISAAARHLEVRSLSTDEISSQLIMPMRHGALFEAVFLHAVTWMAAGYAVPTGKIELARSLDPMISDETAERLRTARFSGTISRAPLVAFDHSVPPPPGGPNAFVVQDEPHVIEILQAPLQCLMDILTFGYESAESAHALKAEAKKTTGGAPTIFHRPYADSRLYATLEALCFYAFGHAIGPYTTPMHLSEIDRSYRAVNVRCRPPIDVDLVGYARVLMEKMLDDLG